MNIGEYCPSQYIILHLQAHAITLYYHPSIPLYLPADSISKTRIKVHVS